MHLWIRPDPNGDPRPLRWAAALSLVYSAAVAGALWLVLDVERLLLKEVRPRPVAPVVLTPPEPMFPPEPLGPAFR